ncbi:MAG: hypothetical protein LBI20_02060 [Holosporales bacterium]|nr:hypothetical protein [Holosporales bacterium]
MRVRCDPDCGRAGYPDIPDGLQYDEDDEEEERAAATVAGESVEPSVSAEAGVPAVPAVPD